MAGELTSGKIKPSKLYKHPRGKIIAKTLK